MGKDTMKARKTDVKWGKCVSQVYGNKLLIEKDGLVWDWLSVQEEFGGQGILVSLHLVNGH